MVAIAPISVGSDKRLDWGQLVRESDWAAANLAASHGGWLEIARSLVPVEDRGAAFDAYALRVYRLPIQDGRTAEKGVKRRPAAPLRGEPSGA